MASGFGLRDCASLLANNKANEVRLITATEFGRRLLRASEYDFPDSLLRDTLFAIREIANAAPDSGADPDLAWLKAEVQDYWSHRKALIALLHYLSRFQYSLPPGKPTPKPPPCWRGRWRMIIETEALRRHDFTSY